MRVIQVTRFGPPDVLAAATAADLAPGPGEAVISVAAADVLYLDTLIRTGRAARAAGAQVIGAARGSAKLGLSWDLGADAVVDYSEPGWTKRVAEMTDGDGPDVVFDGAGGQLGREAFEIMADGGRFSAHGSASGSFAAIDPDEAGRRGVTVRGIEQVQLRPGEHEALAQRALAERAAGRIRPVIGQVFPLARAADAHAALEARAAPGKTLLTVP